MYSLPWFFTFCLVGLDLKITWMCLENIVACFKIELRTPQVLFFHLTGRRIPQLQMIDHKPERDLPLIYIILNVIQHVMEKKCTDFFSPICMMKASAVFILRFTMKPAGCRQGAHIASMNINHFLPQKLGGPHTDNDWQCAQVSHCILFIEFFQFKVVSMVWRFIYFFACQACSLSLLTLTGILLMWRCTPTHLPITTLEGTSTLDFFYQVSNISHLSWIAFVISPRPI